MARVFVILYMVSIYFKMCMHFSYYVEQWFIDEVNNLLFYQQAVLHLWVMIVLLTYTPEMHNGQPGGR